MPKKNESPTKPRPTIDEMWADVHRQFAEIKKASYDEGYEDAKKDRAVEPHEVGELLKDLHVMKTHFSNAMEDLQKLKERLEQLNTQMMVKK